MKRYLKLFISIVFLLVVFTTFNQQAEAANNPISPKQSRVTYILKDVNGATYKVYFAGTNEQKAIASPSRGDWTTVGMDAGKGDVLYKENYRLYTQSTKNRHIKATNFYFSHYILNTTGKTIHIFPSKYKKYPDILAVAYSIGNDYECAYWFYVKNGVLAQIMYRDTNLYSKRE
ncbi:hypothetical protein [Pseudobacillus wudalianchiensis]|uniref:DUF5050 domain-containing protein n=1 Tax=Pseudobacillus wudalianchiensis TaxID=1743143 RepID=A0A1B9AN71_9BACI|nr:hypothetical protein [Bacillus wudalianchiensis]OCA85211.1 hypothetical protein A8F95_11085 [Bacillus wudalianchiensis]